MKRKAKNDEQEKDDRDNRKHINMINQENA